MAHQRNWKTEPAEVFLQGPVIPVIVIDDLSHAVPLAKALVAGGVRVLEITLRTTIALEAIWAICHEVEEAVVGAGTVTTPAELHAVGKAGAVFAISPGSTPELLNAGNRGAVALIPGVTTVSELMAGVALGYTHFKFFPAEVSGGANALKAFAGPFPKVTFCPTGGISPSNYRDYLALENVACVGGSWLVPTDAVQRGDWAGITRLAREAVRSARRYRRIL